MSRADAKRWSNPFYLGLVSVKMGGLEYDIDLLAHDEESESWLCEYRPLKLVYRNASANKIFTRWVTQAEMEENWIIRVQGIYRDTTERLNHAYQERM